MRSLLTLGLILLTTIAALSQSSVQQFFDKYQDDESFTQINISPKMFQMISSMDSEDPNNAEMMEMIGNLKGLKILTTDVNSQKYYKEFNDSFDKSVYEELMTVRENESDITFLVRESSGNIVNELLLLVGGAQDFVLMSFEGRIPLDKIGKLASGLNISGAEHLDKLKK
jgi:DNA phosphorothioation-dependent restriction protein DptG